MTKKLDQLREQKFLMFTQQIKLTLKCDMYRQYQGNILSELLSISWYGSFRQKFLQFNTLAHPGKELTPLYVKSWICHSWF